MRFRLKCAAVVCFVGVVATQMPAQSGADIFKVRCAMCHGMDGQANTPAGKIFKAASFTDPEIIKIPDDQRLEIVKNGKNKMPQFKNTLTDDQIKSVLQYIRTLEKK